MNSRNMMSVGFRFRPTDEELVNYFLVGKINGDSIIQNGIITDIDIYQYEPPELYDESFDNGDGKMYFFSPVHLICQNGKRAKRDTKKGYWRASQKSSKILDNQGNIIGTKMPLVYHSRVQNQNETTSIKTSWLMSEYRLTKENTTVDPSMVEGISLCVVYYNERKGSHKEELLYYNERKGNHQEEEMLTIANEMLEMEPRLPEITHDTTQSIVPISISYPNQSNYHTIDNSFPNPILVPPQNTFPSDNLIPSHYNPSFPF